MVVAMDLGLLNLVASLEASWDNTFLTSEPQHPYVSTAKGVQTQPSSEHFASLAWCFLSSAAHAADPAVTLASANYLK